jgi:hypothetical protein
MDNRLNLHRKDARNGQMVHIGLALVAPAQHELIRAPKRALPEAEIPNTAGHVVLAWKHALFQQSTQL